MKIYKNGICVHDTIDDTGTNIDSSLSSKYAWGLISSLINNLANNYYNKDAVLDLVSGKSETIIVPTKPANPSKNTYYLVGNDEDGYTLYYYDKYLNEAEISQGIDLTPYLQKTTQKEKVYGTDELGNQKLYGQGELGLYDDTTLDKDPVGKFRLKPQTSAEEAHVWEVNASGLWALVLNKKWLEVPTFVGLTPNVYTLYILTEDVTISGVEYKKGFYTWDAMSGYALRSGASEVFTDVGLDEELPDTSINNMTIYRKAIYVYLHNSLRLYVNPIGYKITDTANVSVSNTGITINSVETLWNNVTTSLIDELITNSQIETSLFNESDFFKYNDTLFDIATNFSQEIGYALYHNPTKTAEGYIQIDNKSDFVSKSSNDNIVYGTDNNGSQQEYNIIDSLSTDYYYKWVKDSTTYYSKTIADGENITLYEITFENGKVKTITQSSSTGTLANEVLTVSEVEYTHDALSDGIYLINSDIKIINTSALNDLLNAAGKVNDVKVAGVSQVKNKEANIQTIDNVEDNWYYAFKNGSTYYYTKSKATGSTAYYQFTYTDNVLTKIENKGNVTVELNANRVPQITISSVIYTLDKTKNDYYIIDPKQKLPSIENETRDLTTEELNRIFEGFYITPPNPSWKYVGVLSYSNGSSLTVGDDWNELLFAIRVQESGSLYYNLVNVVPKVGFTVGNPTNNLSFIGFFWNEGYNTKLRVGLSGTGANRVVTQNYSQTAGWVPQFTYVYKR